MRLAPGQQLGPYEITATIGAGGMGEVYRARDTRLERTVAIKILSHLSSDPARRQRFDREARAISCLNHPNICVLHDIGHQDGIDYLVMECIEGETLARKLEKGPLPIDQVLKVGGQIADALDKAHRAGIVHRDLKPGNIMLTSTGAKLLDFGLAKPAALADFDAMTATKAESPITERGTIVGTFQYMSPEQVEGRELDGRSDIFSLGAVLYEMVTGQRAFEGKSRLSVASAILEKEPAPVTTLKPLAPPALEHAIRVCLAKNPDERWQTARDLSHELKWIGEVGSQAGAPAVTGRGWRAARIAWATAAILLGALGSALGVAYFRKATPSAQATVVRSAILPPAGSQFADLLAQSSGAPAISPDGKQLVSAVRDTQGKFSLWLRGLNDAGGGRMLPGTEGGGLPFWSPDGRSIGFFAGGKLKRIDTDGDLLQTLCDASQGRGGAWSPDGIILFTPNAYSPLYEIPANGGTPRQITILNTARGENSHRWPVFLADGRHFLFFLRDYQNPEVAGIYAGSLDSQDYHMVVRTSQGPAFEARGSILYVRDGAVVAQPFDERKLVATGEPTVLPDRVGFSPGTVRALFGASPAGVLAYYPASPGGFFGVTWYERDGRRGDPLGTNDLLAPALSPDGTHAVVTIFGTGGGADIWSFDLSRGTKTRLTSMSGSLTAGVWQSDGRFVLFSSVLKDVPHIFRVKSDGTGSAESVLETSGVVEIPGSVCRDGRYLAYTRTPTGSQASVWILPLAGDRKPFALVQSQFRNTAPAFSPDCKWVAYASNDTGQSEVYITHFPEVTRRYQVSTQGGTFPRWRGDGKELFYYSQEQTSMMAVNVDERVEELSLGSPRGLFHLANSAGIFSPFFDVTADGRRFLISETNPTAGSVPLTLVTNWDAELNKR
jgi:Tol biopolymer transport system component